MRALPVGLLLPFASFLVASLNAGCALENPSYLEDTTGAQLGWSCDLGSCTTVHETFSPPIPTGCGEDTALLVGAGPLAVLCAVSRAPDGSDEVHERTCRPLRCADELDCPQWSARSYTCIEGLCQSEGIFDRIDVTALCLHDVPRHPSCPDAEADAELDRRLAAVDDACADGACAELPPGCLQP